MGRNAAANIRRRGGEMVVCDARAQAYAPLLAMGAAQGESPADVQARCDVVVKMVFGPREVAEMLRGPQGFPGSNCRGKPWEVQPPG